MTTRLRLTKRRTIEVRKRCDFMGGKDLFASG